MKRIGRTRYDGAYFFKAILAAALALCMVKSVPSWEYGPWHLPLLFLFVILFRFLIDLAEPAVRQLFTWPRKPSA